MPSQKGLSVGFLFDDTLDSNDGVAQHVKLLGSWLTTHGHKVSYLVGQTKMSEWAGGKVYSLSKNQTVYFNGNKLSVPLLANGGKIKRVLDEGHFDILHVMTPYSPFMSQRVINRAAASTSIVGTFHIYPSGWLSRAGSHILRLMYGRSLKKVQQFVSVSSAAADFARQAYGIDSYVVPNPVETSRFQGAKAAAKLPGEKRIVFLGRLVKRKGCRQLIEAFAVLSQKMPEARLVIAGDGSDRQSLESLTKQLKVSDRVDFLGYIDEADKPGLLASADIACFPSLYGESFGIVLVEAMAAGAGVVLGGDNPGYRTVLGEKPELLINPSDKAAFAKRLQTLLKDTDLSSQLHKWQAKKVDQYDIDVIGQEVLKLYRRAIAKRGAPKA